MKVKQPDGYHVIYSADYSKHKWRRRVVRWFHKFLFGSFVFVFFVSGACGAADIISLAH